MTYTFLPSFSTFLELPSGLSIKRTDCLIAYRNLIGTEISFEISLQSRAMDI